jgi:hypothetical protein
MRFEISQALAELVKLDLSTYPYKDAKRLISQLGRFGCIKVTLHEGKTIMRARPNFDGERFTSTSQLSYKPQSLNKTYQRASTPNKTMFYASTIPETIQAGELDNTRVIGAFEALPWLRDKTTKGYQKISYGQWRVKLDINLIAIVQHENFYNESSYTRELAEMFKKYTNAYPDLKDETIAIADFFAKEFAKSDTSHDYDYLISATFSETVVDKGLDGILYPSVRLGGKGFNIAINPEVADNSLELVAAGECSIYKLFDNTVVDNETVVELNPNQTNFQFRPVAPQFHAGVDNCLKRLGVNSITDLIS